MSLVLAAHPQHARGFFRNELRAGMRCQIDQPDAVWKLFDEVAGGLEHKPGLARAAWAEQGEQTVAFEQSINFLQLHCAANKRGQLGRQVVGI